MISLKERYIAALVGVGIGDALGAPYEIRDRATIMAAARERGGLGYFEYPDPFGKDGIFPGGNPTDDSELTAALAESLYVWPSLNDSDMYDRFRACVIDHQSQFWKRPSYGFGGTTRKSLKAETYAEALAEPDRSPPLPSNGSLMRIAPVALRFHGQPGALTRAAFVSTIVTHRNPLAAAVGIVYVHLLDGLLSGKSYEEVLASGVLHRYTQDPQTLRALDAEPAEPFPPVKETWGGAVNTLRVALWALTSATSFADGMERCIFFGGDTDTYAAVAGALLGARFGLEGIPEPWLTGLVARKRFTQLASDLYEARYGDEE